MYRYLCSKKGYTLFEVIIVLVIMSILVAVAVPIFAAYTKNRKIKDCAAQRQTISTAVKEVMYGMVDNGKKQTYTVSGEKKCVININSAAHITSYNGQNCFVLVSPEFLAKLPDNAPINKYTTNFFFTIGDIRGGYRPSTIAEYADGCDAGYFLKKKALKDKPFYEYLSNQEVPPCPFADDTHFYYYYVTATGDVLCSCPDCQ